MAWRLVALLAVFFITSTPIVAQERPAQPTPGQAARQNVERVLLTPSRIVAPVGSEVILKASIAADAPKLTATFEWFLSNTSKGHFLQVDANPDDKKGEHSPTSGIASGTYAKGSASIKDYKITRGNDTTLDDLSIAKGESWISVTSIEEGDSEITCMSPTIDNWDLRKAAASIYWVDAQWLFPEPAEAESGDSVVLETRLSRSSNFAPRKDWIVRYEFKSGAPITFTAAANDAIVEVLTDSEGLARVELQTTNKGDAESEVTIQVIQPAAETRPRFIVGEGIAKISWKKSVVTKK